MKMNQQIKRLKRPCKKCKKIYQPDNKYGKICPKCMEKVIEIAKEHGFQGGNLNRRR